ncbi:MAG TPA: hypothetical protein VFI20_03600, partial [Terracidiphilus sp.]|nr:hypothetical protein [Terracidiphilus sp.]
IDRPGRFRSLGDGQVDFRAIFSKLAQYDYPGWAVLEWECCLKHPKVGAAEGAAFIRDRIIRVTDHAFDDFASSGTDAGMNRNILGLNPSAKAAAPAVAVIPQVPAAESVDTAPPTKAQAASVAEKNAEAVGEWAQTSASPVPVVGIDAKAAAKAEWAAEPASSSPVKSTPQPVLNKPVVVEARRKREQEPSPQPERGKEHSVSKLELVEPAEAVSPAPTQTSRPHATVDPEAGKEIEPRTVTPEISAGKSPAKIERTAGPVVVESVMAASAAAVADQASTLDVKKPVREPDPPTVVVDTRTVATTKPESRPFERQTAPVEMQSAVPVEEVPESAVARTVAPIPETVDLARVTPEAQTEAPQVPAEKRSAKGRVQSRMEIAEPEPEPAAAGIADAKAAARAEWYAEPPAPTLVANEPEPEMSEPARIAYDWTREPQPADESAASEAESIQAPAWATHEEQSPVIEPEEEIAEPAQIEYKWQHEPEAEAQAEPAPEKKSRMNGAAPNGTKSDAPAAGSAWKAVKKWWKEHDPAPSPYGKEWGRPAGAPARVQSPAEEQPESGSGSPVALLEEADSWQFLKPVSVHKPRVESQPEFTLSRAQAVDEPRVVEEFNTEAVSTIQAVPEREAAPAEQRGMTEPPVVLETVEAPVASAPELRAETQNEPESASEQHDDSEWLPFS